MTDGVGSKRNCHKGRGRQRGCRRQLQPPQVPATRRTGGRRTGLKSPRAGQLLRPPATTRPDAHGGKLSWPPLCGPGRLHSRLGLGGSVVDGSGCTGLSEDFCWQPEGAVARDQASKEGIALHVTPVGSRPHNLFGCARTGAAASACMRAHSDAGWLWLWLW